MNGLALSIIAESTLLGLTLKADGNAIRFTPRERMTRELADKIRENKTGIILALTRQNDLEPPTPPTPTLDRVTPSKTAQASAAKPRIDTASLIRAARQNGDKQLAWRLKDSFNERAAICEFSGNLPRPDAEQVAADEVAGIASRWTTPTVTAVTANESAITSPTITWLTEALSRGPRTGKHVIETGREQGFSENELRQALDVIGGYVWISHPRSPWGGCWILREWERQG